MRTPPWHSIVGYTIICLSEVNEEIMYGSIILLSFSRSCFSIRDYSLKKDSVMQFLTNIFLEFYWYLNHGGASEETCVVHVRCKINIFCLLFFLCYAQKVHQIPFPFFNYFFAIDYHTTLIVSQCGVRIEIISSFLREDFFIEYSGD